MIVGFYMIVGNRHPKCKAEAVNHPLDPYEMGCGYNTTIDCEDCIYNNSHKGRKNPESKCNQPKDIVTKI